MLPNSVFESVKNLYIIKEVNDLLANNSQLMEFEKCTEETVGREQLGHEALPTGPKSAVT